MTWLRLDEPCSYLCRNMRPGNILNWWTRTLFIFLISIFFFLFALSDLYAQQAGATVKIVNAKNEPVPFASLRILSVEDSAQLFRKITDSNGIAFVTLGYGQYTFDVSSVNYLPLKKGITIKAARPFFLLSLKAPVNSLKEVVVNVARPIMRQEEDKTIVDPENLAASSTNAYEILEKTPGLFVDQDGNIYLNSTTPATIYINGREQKLNASDIATMLKNLPPNSIAAIEILRNPSAKYDASGAGGIVNVVLKKGVKIGLTGSITLGGNQGRYGNAFTGLNLNNNNGRVSSYLNVQLARRSNYEETSTERLFAADSSLHQDAFSLYPTHNYYLGYGLNAAISKKWEIGYDGKINYSDFLNTTENFSRVTNAHTEEVITGITSDVDNRGHNFNVTQGISGKYKVDTAGSVWNIDISYNYSPNSSDQSFVNTLYFPVNAISSGNGIIKAKLNFSAMQSDLLLKLPQKVTVETGLKSSVSGFNNTTDYFRQAAAGPIKDAGRTSAFHYKENINAFYLQASKNMYGITVKAGTRLENTNMTGNQFIPVDTFFSVHRTDLFPYVYISRDLFKIMGYGLKAYLVYRRTISRPGYQLLNPSQRYVDQYLFETGNPALRPQFTQNYEANVSVDERPVVAIGINNTKDIFTNVIYQTDSSRSIAYRTYDNLGSNREIYFRALGAIPQGKKYFIVAGIQFNRNFYQGVYEDRPLLFKRGSWSIFTYQTLKLTPVTQLSLNGFARFHGQLQFYQLTAFGALNFSVNQQLLKRKLNLSCSINDVFLTNRNNFTIQQGSINAYGFRKADTRRFGFNFRYNFGFRKKESNSPSYEELPEKNE